MTNRVLIILGMHRSGTSFIAQWLSKSGLHLGDELLPAQEENKDGYYEDIDFLEAHEQIFRKYGIPYGGFENLEKLKLDLNDLEILKALIEKKNQKHSQWGWKEPRTCLFAEYYLQLLPEAKFLVIVRDFNAVINSLLKRHFDINRFTHSVIKNFTKRFFSKTYRNKFQKLKSTAAKYAKATIFYYEKILSILENIPKNNVFVVEFEKITEYEPDLRKKLKQWNFDLNFVPIKKIYKPDYIHHLSNHRNKFIPKRLSKQLNHLQNKLLEYAKRQP